MVRVFYANNTQMLGGGPGQFHPPGHLETMTLDAGVGLYEGSVDVSADGQTLTLLSDPPTFAKKRRPSWKVAAAMILEGQLCVVSCGVVWRRG
jgi:hypothetical protein